VLVKYSFSFLSAAEVEMSAMVVGWWWIEAAMHNHAGPAFHASIGGSCVGFGNHKLKSQQPAKA
jgi:hypothetical protein